MNKLRTLEIVEYIEDKKHCSMADLMARFNVSPATIHRDITELTKKKLIQKVRGGVASLSNEPETVLPSVNSHFSARAIKNQDLKNTIAQKAIKSVNDSDIIFLDSSTTALHFAREIQKMNFTNLTIITNSVLIIQEFNLFPPHFFLISIGGNFDCQLNSFLGTTAIDNLKRLKVNKAFFSAAGITKSGITTYKESHAEFLREVLDLADNNYLLIDSSKFDKAGIFEICNLDSINHIISDKRLKYQ